MLALIEGDANNVMSRYLKGLSAAERQQYDREQRAPGTDFGKATVGVPPFVQLLFSAPYELGPFTIRMLIADGGNAAVNSALTGPTPTSADFVQAGLIAPPPPNFRRRRSAAGEEADGKPEAFGAFELYLMLATRDDAAIALKASDAVLGGRAQGLRRDGTYCYRATLAIRDQPGAKFVAGSLQQWGRSATGASGEQRGTSGSPSPRAIRAPRRSGRRRTSSRPPSSCWPPDPASPSAPPKTACLRTPPGAWPVSSRQSRALDAVGAGGADRSAAPRPNA